MFHFSNYSANSKYYDDWSKLNFGKMKNEMDDTAIEEFVGLKPKMYSFLVEDSSEQKKQKVWTKMFLLNKP